MVSTALGISLYPVLEIANNQDFQETVTILETIKVVNIVKFNVSIISEESGGQ